MDWPFASVQAKQKTSDECEQTEFTSGLRIGFDTIGFAEVQQNRIESGHVWSNHICNLEIASGLPAPRLAN